MPTKHTRLTVVVTDEVMGMLDHLSSLTGNSKSSMVGDLLSQSMPTFQRMAELLQAAQSLNLKAVAERDKVTSTLSEAQDRLEEHLGVASREFDQAVSKIKRRQRRAATGAGEAATVDALPSRPPVSNRGVHYPKTSQKTNRSSIRGK